MTTLLETGLATLLVGAMVTINGVAISPEKIMADANTAVNGANIHQIATVLELYYMDHDKYPQVSGGEELINVFEEEGYIQTKPIDAKVFSYEPTDNAQNYKLSLNQ